MRWEELLSPKRAAGWNDKEECSSSDLRSEFEKDYHRIIGSASFRRLQDKTQVFPLDKSDFIRTRLTHSLEVASFAKSLGQNVGERILALDRERHFTVRMKEDVCHILECAGLIHDIGNPPFGHFGEIAIREWFEDNLSSLTLGKKSASEILSRQMKEDLYHFEGNAQALRLVGKLHFLADEHGMNLTYALLSSMIKYPVNSLETKGGKIGYYYADKDIFDDVSRTTGTNGCRHPLSYLLEAADDIAYKTADIEDAFVKGFIGYQEFLDELRAIHTDRDTWNADEILEILLSKGKELGVESPQEYAVKNWTVRVQGYLIQEAAKTFMAHYEEIMAGIYKGNLIEDSSCAKLMGLLGDVADRKVFCSSFIYRMEATESAVLTFLMNAFVRAAVKYDSKERMSTVEKRMVSLISENYKNAYHRQAKGKEEDEKLYLRILLATDYICGMTDSYAKRLYQELNAMN